MILVKDNKEKGRKVYELEDRFRKVWSTIDQEKLEQHVIIMNKILPGYVLNWGSGETDQFIDVKKIPGTTAEKLERTPEFVKKIHDFCLYNIKQTYPYAHFDWVLSNIMIDGDNMYMVDWDNVGIYTEKEIRIKLNSDLKNAFKEKYKAYKRKLKSINT
jgi:aminoglycoside phosphotransferase